MAANHALSPPAAIDAAATRSAAWHHLPRLQFGWRRRVPLIVQSESSECAVACLAMVAGYHGLRVDLPGARAWLPPSGLGTSIVELVSAAHDIGLAARAMRATMKGLKGLALPAVLHWNLDHFVVLTKISDGHLWIHDPATGSRRVPIDEAARSFTGIAIEMRPAASFRPRDERRPLRWGDFTGRLVGFRLALAHLFGLSLAIELLGLLGPALSQAIIDNVAISGNTNFLATLMAASFGILMLNLGVSVVRSRAILRFSTQWNLQWMGNVFRHMLDLRPSYYERRQVGDVMSRFGSVGAIQQALSTDLIASILDGIMAFATLAVAFHYSRDLTLVVIAGVVLIGSIRLLAYGPMKRYAAETLRHQATASSLLIESIRSMRIFKLFGVQAHRLDQMLNRQVDAMNPQLRSATLDIALDTVSGALSGIQRLLLIGLGAYAIHAGQMSVGMLFAFLAYSDQFASRVLSLIDHLLSFRMLRVHLDRLSDIVLEKGETPEHAADEDAPEAAPAAKPAVAPMTRAQGPQIEFRKVSFRYGAGLPFVFENLSFAIQAGEWVVVTGPSGSGKTSLAKLLLRLEEPTSGEILVNGRPIAEWPIQALRATFGAVLQDDMLLRGSIQDNVCVFAENPDPDWMMACVDAAQIGDFVRALPMGLMTPVDESGSSLSAGQRQRLLIARALYKRPGILLLDEASSHLDVETERRLNDALRTMPLTRVVFAHRPETIAAADRRLHLPKFAPALE